MNAVRNLFCKKGLSVTSKELSQAAGVSEALIYKLFNSKEELYQALLEKACSANHGIGNELTQQPPSTKILVFATLLMIHIKIKGTPSDNENFSLTPQQIRGLILQSLQNDGEVARTMFNQGLGPWVKSYVNCLEAAQKAGDLEPTPIPLETLIWITHHSMFGIKVMHHPTPNAFMAENLSDDDLINLTLLYCLRGMGLKEDAINKITTSNEFKNFNQKLNHSQETYNENI